MLHVIILPANYSSGEMEIAYFILIVPEILKVLSVYSWIGILIVLIFYYSARVHKPALLTIYEDYISIAGKGVDIRLPDKTIEKFFCNDLKNSL
jgi:hypothetical protein